MKFNFKFSPFIFFYSLCFGLFNAAFSQAGIFELSGGYALTRSTYNGGSYTHETSWTASFGFYFTEESEFELMYQDTKTNDYVPGVQNTTNRDRVYSANLLFHLAAKDAWVKPYVRGGIGQLNRDATGTYEGGYAPPGQMDEVTVIGGLGIKMKINDRFGAKAEAVTYLQGGSISTWQDNLNVTVGGSIYF
jgi:hypothetical protein